MYFPSFIFYRKEEFPMASNKKQHRRNLDMRSPYGTPVMIPMNQIFDLFFNDLQESYAEGPTKHMPPTGKRQHFKYIVQCDDMCYSGVVTAADKHTAMYLLSLQYKNPVAMVEPLDTDLNTIDEIDRYELIAE